MTAKRWLTGLLAGAAMTLASQAQAVTTWTYSYTGVGVTASGTFTTAGNAAVAEDVLSFTGKRNGVTILGLVPLFSDDNYSYDNQFSRTAPYFTTDGLLYDIGGADADAHINLYFDPSDGAFHDLRLNADASAITDTVVAFTVTAVPEASTLAYMALGLGALGFAARRSRKAAAVV